MRQVHQGLMRDNNPEYLSALTDIESFRSGFESPLSTLVQELENLVLKKSLTFPVANRSKQINRIGKKLILQPNMRLSQMDDIGGCRIVATDEKLIDLLAYEIRAHYSVQSESDYRVNRRSSGYRALHLIVKFMDHKIEIQLRTHRQHTWAELVETLDKKYKVQLKDEIGPEVLRTWLTVISDSFAELDHSGTQSVEQQIKLTSATNQAVEWMSEADNESN